VLHRSQASIAAAAETRRDATGERTVAAATIANARSRRRDREGTVAAAQTHGVARWRRTVAT